MYLLLPFLIVLFIMNFAYCQEDDSYLYYYNDLLKFEISIPSDWKEKEGDNYVLFTPSNNFNNFSESFIIYSYKLGDLPYFNNENKTYNDIINGELDLLKSFYNNFTLIKEPTSISMNNYNLSFFEFSYFNILDGNGKINGKEYLLINDGNLYILSYQDKSLSYLSNSKIFENIIQSFRILQGKDNISLLPHVRGNLSEISNKTYTNFIDRLKFDYPSNWKITKKEVSDSVFKFYPYSRTLILYPPNVPKLSDLFETFYVNITVRNNYGTDHIMEFNSSKSKMMQDKFHYNIINEDIIKVGGIDSPSIYFSYKNNSDTSYINSSIIKSNDRIYNIQFSFRESFFNITEIFNQILNSIEFYNVDKYAKLFRDNTDSSKMEEKFVPKTNKVMKINYSIPQNWDFIDQNNTAIYIYPSYYADIPFLGITVSPGSYEGIEYDIESNINSLKSVLANFNMTNFEKTEIENQRAYKIDYTSSNTRTDPSLEEVYHTIYFLRNGPQLFTLFYEGDFTNYIIYKENFENIINNIKFSHQSKKNVTNQTGSKLDFSPIDISINPLSNKIYVASGNSREIGIIDKNTTLLKSKISIDGIPDSTAFNQFTNKLYVTSPETGKVYVVDGYSDKIQEIFIGYGLGEVAIDPIEFENTGSLIFVNNYNNDSIEVVDGGTNKVIKSIALENSPYRIGLDPIINRIFVTHSNIFPSEITIIDYLTDMNRNIEIQKKSIKNLGLLPYAVWVDSSTKKAFFVDIWNNTVFALDSITLNQKSIIMNKTGLNPNSISFNPKNFMLYIGNSGMNFVTALNVNTGRSQPIYTDSPILDIAIDQDNNMVYMANYESQTLSKINSLNKLVVTVKFQIFPDNAGYIECNKKKINNNEFITFELGTKCYAYSNSGYEFKDWLEKKASNISNKTKIEFQESIIYLFNNISKKFFNFYTNNNNNINPHKIISKNEVISANFVSSSLFENIKLAGPSLSIILLFISTLLVVFGPSIIYKKNSKKNQSEPIKKLDILGLDGGIIAGVLIFLSLTEGFDVSEQTQITIITVNIVFPFTISAILAIINQEKYATRLMIGGFVNLIIAVILIAIMKI